MNKEKLERLYNNQVARNHDEESKKRQLEALEQQRLVNQKARERLSLLPKTLSQKALIAHVNKELNVSQSERQVRCMQFKNNDEKRIDHAINSVDPSQFMEAPQPMLSLDCPEFLELANFRIKKNGTYMTLNEYVYSFIDNFFKKNDSSIDLSSCKEERQLHVALFEDRKKDETDSGVDATYKIETKFEASKYKGRPCYLIRMAFKPSSIPGEYTTFTNQGKEDAHVIALHPDNPTGHIYATSATFGATSVENQLYSDLKDSNDPNDQALAKHAEESHALIITATCVPTERFPSCRLVADCPSDPTSDGGGEPKSNSLASDYYAGKIVTDGPTRQSRPATQNIHAIQTHNYSQEIIQGEQVPFVPGSYQVEVLHSDVITPMVLTKELCQATSEETSVAQIISAMHTKSDCLIATLYQFSESIQLENYQTPSFN